MPLPLEDSRGDAAGREAQTSKGFLQQHCEAIGNHQHEPDGESSMGKRAAGAGRLAAGARTCRRLRLRCLASATFLMGRASMARIVAFSASTSSFDSTAGGLHPGTMPLRNSSAKRAAANAAAIESRPALTPSELACTCARQTARRPEPAGAASSELLREFYGRSAPRDDDAQDAVECAPHVALLVLVEPAR